MSTRTVCRPGVPDKQLTDLLLYLPHRRRYLEVGWWGSEDRYPSDPGSLEEMGPRRYGRRVNGRTRTRWDTSRGDFRVRVPRVGLGETRTEGRSLDVSGDGGCLPPSPGNTSQTLGSRVYLGRVETHVTCGAEHVLKPDRRSQSCPSVPRGNLYYLEVCQ